MTEEVRRNRRTTVVSLTEKTLAGKVRFDGERWILGGNKVLLNAHISTVQFTEIKP